VQTFLPYPDYLESAQVLDNQRLGKQRVETYQLLRCIRLQTGWKNHPAAKMWTGYEYQLANYGIVMCGVWISKGFKDTCLRKILEESRHWQETGPPYWIGDPKVHISHQSNLVRKRPDIYQSIWPHIGPHMPYYWPPELKPCDALSAPQGAK
jgi:hypothetical protein